MTNNMEHKIREEIPKEVDAEINNKVSEVIKKMSSKFEGKISYCLMEYYPTLIIKDETGANEYVHINDAGDIVHGCPVPDSYITEEQQNISAESFPYEVRNMLYDAGPIVSDYYFEDKEKIKNALIQTSKKYFHSIHMAIVKGVDLLEANIPENAPEWFLNVHYGAALYFLMSKKNAFEAFLALLEDTNVSLDQIEEHYHTNMVEKMDIIRKAKSLKDLERYPYLISIKAYKRYLQLKYLRLKGKTEEFKTLAAQTEAEFISTLEENSSEENSLTVMLEKLREEIAFANESR
ncbi:hypothetical protein GF340_03355 [Candidatus Peregrinibacteria bacterium]|nr:hypothetical protein [Candidatus Peregrinibacteria bacterium]